LVHLHLHKVYPVYLDLYPVYLHLYPVYLHPCVPVPGVPGTVLQR